MRILIAAPVHQKPHIFKEYLESLDRLLIPEGVEVDRFFVLHNCEELLPMIKDNSLYAIYNTENKYKVDEVTHVWTDELVGHVTGMKNCIIEFAREHQYDYLFFVDSDLILHPLTLSQLLSAQKDIVAEVFWTKWGPDAPAAPNAWDYNMYAFKSESRWQEWETPGLYRIGMTGACILISRPVIQAGVNYNRVYNIAYWGEDRHFCIRAAAHDFEIWLDTNFPCTHLYRDSEYEQYMKIKAGENGG